jgi:hypothetical protein
MSKAPPRELPESILRRGKDKGRRFPTLAGDRVNVWVVVLKYKVSPTTVYARAEKAGLMPVEMPYPVGEGWNDPNKQRTTKTWLESEIDPLFCLPLEYGAPDDPYYHKAEIHRRLGISPQTLTMLGERGRVKTIEVNDRQGGPRKAGGKKIVYRLKDCEDYMRPTGRRFSGIVFQGVYEIENGERKQRAFNLRKAADLYDIPLTTLITYTDKSKTVCHYLPEGYLPSFHRIPPAPWGGQAETVVLEEDMERLRAAMQGAQRRPSQMVPADGLHTAREIAEHHGLTAPWDYARLGVLLRRLFESGQLARTKTRRFSKRRGQCYRPWGYDLDALNRLLGSRKLRDIVAEITPAWATGDNVVLNNGQLGFPEERAGADSRRHPAEPTADNAISGHDGSTSNAETTAPWDSFISGKEACRLTAFSPSQVSKLCKPNGPIRYERRGRRLRVHAGDLARYLSERDEAAEDE